MTTPHPSCRRLPAAWALVLLAMPAWAAAQGAGGLGALFRPPSGVEAKAAAPADAASAATAPTRGVRVVLVGEDRRVAEINGFVVRVGDVVAGLRVQRIGLDAVVLVAEDGSTERWPVNPAIASAKRPARAATAPPSATPIPRSREPRQGAQP